MENGKKYAHIQMSQAANSEIFVVEVSQVIDFLDEMMNSGIDISKCLLLKTTIGA
jgi:hypothetical protein